MKLHSNGYKPDAIIFDIDGTLWNACGATAKGWNKALAELRVDHQVKQAEVEAVAGNPYKICVEKVLAAVVDVSPSLFALLDKHEVEAIQAEGGKFYSGVIDGLLELARFHQLFLVSNCQDWYLEEFLKFTGMREEFAGVDCHGRSNAPKEEMLRRMKEDFKLVNPVYVGDTAGDQLAAEMAGVDFVHAAWGFQDVESPALSFDSFEELMNHFKSP